MNSRSISARVEEVALVKLDAVGDEREVALVQRGRIERLVEVVEADDGVAARGEARGQVRADEPGDAGEKHLHATTLPLGHVRAQASDDLDDVAGDRHEPLGLHERARGRAAPAASVCSESSASRAAACRRPSSGGASTMPSGGMASVTSRTRSSPPMLVAERLAQLEAGEAAAVVAAAPARVADVVGAEVGARRRRRRGRRRRR